jgi:hypothetical protein
MAEQEENPAPEPREDPFLFEIVPTARRGRLHSDLAFFCSCTCGGMCNCTLWCEGCGTGHTCSCLTNCSIA